MKRDQELHAVDASIFSQIENIASPLQGGDDLTPLLDRIGSDRPIMFLLAKHPMEPLSFTIGVQH